MKKASNVVYITDNCGEIVLDKIAIQILKKNISEYTGHSAGARSACRKRRYHGRCGVLRSYRYLYRCLVTAAMWEVPGFYGISTHARELLQGADVILAKGQGNYETMHGCGLNIYYLFLCKCDWFQQLFHAKLLQGMFINEKRAPKATAFSSD